jgi:transposase
MEQQLERVAGLDVHRKTIAVCVRVPGEQGERTQHLRTFGTTAVELLTLRDWLEAHGVTDVALESTGVYWKPVFYVLEEAVQCLLVNAQHVQKVPGRKTDVQDCVWLAQLLEHGLLRGSFVPPPPQRELRDLTRYRKSLIQERTREANRLHKVLEDAGIKLATVATDILGVSGRAMLQALLAGTTDPAVLADLARGTLRKKLPACHEAIAPDGMVWVSWPKKSSGVATDVTENVVRDTALSLGLVDVKVCAVDDTWSGLKLVLRKENRGDRA